MGRNGVPLLHEDHAGYELRRGHTVPRAVPDDGGVRGRHLAQRRHRLLRARLLDVAHDGVEEHHGEDRHRLVGSGRVALDQPQPGQDRGGDQQQNDEHVAELPEELPLHRHRLLRRQLVPAVAF